MLRDLRHAARLLLQAKGWTAGSSRSCRSRIPIRSAGCDGPAAIATMMIVSAIVGYLPARRVSASTPWWCFDTNDARIPWRRDKRRATADWQRMHRADVAASRQPVSLRLERRTPETPIRAALDGERDAARSRLMVEAPRHEPVHLPDEQRARTEVQYARPRAHPCRRGPQHFVSCSSRMTMITPGCSRRSWGRRAR